MVVFTIVLLVDYCITGSATYEGWSALFANQFMKLLSFLALFSLFYHAWIGVRDIWMDYIKPVGLRLGLQVFSIVWLVGCAGWAIQVLWRV
jgi:succinate dehydrogenase / fumarate reductase membrane anchor subunit